MIVQSKFVLYFLYPVDQNANYDAKRVHMDNLYRMVQYCENKTDCRRAQLLGYFGELFDKERCKEITQAVCDNCNSKVCHSIM